MEKKDYGKNLKVKRESNVEICRIVCMLMIIAHHCVVHGGGIYMELCKNKYIAWLIFPGGKLCFDAFLAISAWFLVDQTFRTERFLKTWTTVFFYSVVFSFASVAMGTVLTWRNWFSILFPITGNSHGFAASYLAFYLLIPFLSIISNKISQKQAKWIVILLLYYQVISKIIGAVSGYYQPLYSEVTLFVLCYFIAFYLKRYPIKLMKNKIFLLGILLLIWGSVFLIYIGANIYFPGNQWIAFLLSLCGDESSILFLFGGFAMFFLFKNIKMPNSSLINKIAHTTFGVLLIHDHNFFRGCVWNNIFHATEWWYSKYYYIYIGICVVIIFVFGMFVDLMRQYFIEKPLFSMKWIKKFSARCDEILNIGMDEQRNETLNIIMDERCNEILDISMDEKKIG